MKRYFLGFCALAAATLGWREPLLAQPTNAQQAAEQLIGALGNQKYKAVWDKQTSEWFRKQTSENMFLANMSMGRAQLGSLETTSLVSSEHTTTDPASGYQGDIYAFTFRDKYSVGEFFERIVVIKEADGQYRLAGLFGTPVPK